MKRLARAAWLGAVLALALPAGASAHATLEATSPQRGATVPREPSQVVFRFDEPVEGNFGAVRVYDSRGQRVDEGAAFHPGGRGPQLGVHLRPSLPDGTYTATYRVVSADGHIVSSGFTFSLGRATVAGETVEQLLGRSGTGRVTSTAFAAARAVQYGALSIAGGAIAFLLLIWTAALCGVAGAGGGWRDASEAVLHRVRVVVLFAAVAGAVSALAGVTLEAAQAAGVSGWSAMKPHVVREVLGTRFGTVWSIAAGCWLAVGLLSVPLLAGGRRRASVLRPASLGAAGSAMPRSGRAALGLLAALLAYLVMVPALSGHGATQSPVAVLFPANVLHVAAMTVWLGGLVCLLAAVPAATGRLAAADRTRLLAGVLERFSAGALGAVIVLLVAGLVQAYVEIRHLDLVLSTAFGRAVLIKLGLLTALIALGALNRQRTVPALRAAATEGRSPGAAGVTLRRTLRGEVALIAAVLAVTGALAGYAPATATSSGPFSATTRIGPQEMQMTVDPARLGVNQVHLYLIDPRTGAQLDAAKEVTIRAALPSKSIGAMTATAQKAGPGHYLVPGFTFGVAGTWQLTVAVRVSDFDEYEKTLQVRVR